MKKIALFFYFIPFVRKTIDRKYFSTGAGTFFLNIFYKYIFRINKGDLLIHYTSRVNNPERIKVLGNDKTGSYFHFATSGGCYYQAINGIEIGEGTIWSYNCCFISANHSKTDYQKHELCLPIKIGKNVWIGANCVILPSVNIGDNVIIGAGSVVVKDIPKNSVAVGNPCKVIKTINE
ncbi:DapH/DapD/GlmU-related protein [Flavobacterium sp.]|uniref:DapH/DapD/GlmU-related protein n=1 Tax=Flavobacterium sp. TaxID=239 RepID=UPI003528959F